MVYVTPTNKSTGDLITTAVWNADVVENMKQNTTEKVTTAGDIVQGTALKVIARLGMSGSGGKFLRANAGATALEYAAVAAAPAGPMDWMKPALLYAISFNQANILNNAVYGDILDAGWVVAGAPAIVATTGVGDANSAADSDASGVWCPANGDIIQSPTIILDWQMLAAMKAINGNVAITQIRIDLFGFFNAAGTDATGASGFGLGSIASGAPNVRYGYFVGATNFMVNDDAADVNTGVARDTAKHKFSFIINVTNETMSYQIDDVAVGGPTALRIDNWPVGVCISCGATLNQPQCSNIVITVT